MNNSENELFVEKFTMYFRSKIYEDNKILVNDMKPVIEEVDLFIKNVLLAPLEEDSKITYRILNAVELYVERHNGTIKEYKWLVNTNQNLDHDIIELNDESIDELFEPFKDEFKNVLNKRNLVDIPRSLLTGAFMCFIKAIDYYINTKTIETEIDIYGIFKLDNNGEMNIIL